MKREIKFRAYSPDSEEMYEGLTLESLSRIRNPADVSVKTVNLVFDFDGLVWMQYTGLKDSIGKEIYEGDIVKLSSNAKIVHQDGGFGFVFQNDIDNDIKPFLNNLHFDSIMRRIEVIGNIHENPELFS